MKCSIKHSDLEPMVLISTLHSKHYAVLATGAENSCIPNFMMNQNNFNLSFLFYSSCYKAFMYGSSIILYSTVICRMRRF